MKSSAKKIRMTSFDDLCGTGALEDTGSEKIREVGLDEIYPFKNHPFKVQDDAAMEDMAESIRKYGVFVPGIVRTIKVKDYKSGGQWKELVLDGVEFVRRFLMHVPPERFVRIRHYGILSNQSKRKLIPICRNLIGCREFLRRFRKDDKAQAIRILYKKDVTVCPCCGGSMSYEVCTERDPKRSSA